MSRSSPRPEATAPDRHQYHLDTGASQFGHLVDDRAHAGDVEHAVGAGEYVATNLYNYSRRFVHDLIVLNLFYQVNLILYLLIISATAGFCAVRCSRTCCSVQKAGGMSP